MEIRQFRVVLRAKDFDRTCHFYEEVLGLTRARDWDHEKQRGAIYLAGSGRIEILGRPRAADGTGQRDEDYDYRGPSHKMTLRLVVPSAKKAYEEMHFREKNVPGGLREDADGVMVYETHDPDGVKIELREVD